MSRAPQASSVPADAPPSAMQRISLSAIPTATAGAPAPYKARRPAFVDAKKVVSSKPADAYSKYRTAMQQKARLSAKPPVAARLGNYGHDDDDDESYVVEDSPADLARQKLLDEAHGSVFEVQFSLSAALESPVDEKHLGKSKETGAPLITFPGAGTEYTFPVEGMAEAFEKGQMIGLIEAIDVHTAHTNRATGVQLACPDVLARPAKTLDKPYPTTAKGAVCAVITPAQIMAHDAVLSDLVVCPAREFDQWDVDNMCKHADYMAKPDTIDKTVHEMGNPEFRNIQADSPILDICGVMGAPWGSSEAAAGMVMVGKDEALDLAKKTKDVFAGYSIFRGPKNFTWHLTPTAARASAITGKPAPASFFSGPAPSEATSYEFGAEGTIRMIVLSLSDAQ